MADSYPVFFHFNNQNFNLQNRNGLKRFICSMFKRERVPLIETGIIFCSDHELLEINKRFLGKDYLTDIITFDLSEKRTSQKAEIYISIDRVRENARSFKSSFNKEIHRVIFHGVLHLCGYDDKTVANKKEMNKWEDFYLKSYFR